MGIIEYSLKIIKCIFYIYFCEFFHVLPIFPPVSCFCFCFLLFPIIFKIYLYITYTSPLSVYYKYHFPNLSVVFFIMFFCRLFYIVRCFSFFFSLFLFHFCIWIWNYSLKTFPYYCFLSTWSNISIAVPVFLVYLFAWNTFDRPFLFNLSESVCSRYVSWIEHMVRSLWAKLKIFPFNRQSQPLHICW